MFDKIWKIELITTDRKLRHCVFRKGKLWNSLQDAYDFAKTKDTENRKWVIDDIKRVK